MKKALKVEFPEDRPLTVLEYEKLKNHAYNSASWYAMNYSKTTKQIRQKLYDKGYPRGEVEVERNKDDVFWVDIVEETVEKLVKLSMVDDESYTETAISSGLRSGKSLSAVKTKLFQAGIPKEMIDEAVENIVEDDDEDLEFESLDRTASKMMRSSTYRKLEGHDLRNKLVKGLLTKRFPLPKVLEWVENNLGDENWD